MVEVSETPKNLKREFLDDDEEEEQASKRRDIRSHYRQLENRIIEEKDELIDVGVDKFMAIMSEVEKMHQHVNKPREQVADAEALLGLTSSLAASVKTHTNGSVTPAEFISCLLRKFGQRKSSSGVPKVLWKDMGVAASPVFKNGTGCVTMMGPMQAEIKVRKSYVRRKRSTPDKNAKPKEVEETTNVMTDTDRNMQVMFEVLKKKRKVKLENLIVNRNCFAQTVENLFALSFLVKDGRAFIDADANGSHFVAPRNAPSAEQIKTGVAKNNQFIFRFDFEDWKLMKSQVVEGEELMPHRYVQVDAGLTQETVGTEDEGLTREETIPDDNSQTEKNIALIKKFTKNYGYNVKQHSDSPEKGVGKVLNWNCKRRRSIL